MDSIFLEHIPLDTLDTVVGVGECRAYCKGPVIVGVGELVFFGIWLNISKDFTGPYSTVNDWHYQRLTLNVR